MNLNTERLQNAIIEDEMLPYKRFEKVFEELFYTIRPYSKVQVKEPDEYEGVKVIVVFCYMGTDYKMAVRISNEDLLSCDIQEMAKSILNVFLKQEKEEILLKLLKED